MKVRNWLARRFDRWGWIPDDVKVNPIFQLVQDDANAAIGREGGMLPWEQNFDAFVKTIGQFPWVTSCIRANCTVSSAVPLKVGIQRGPEEIDVVEDHPILDVLERPHAEIDGEGKVSFYWALCQQMEYFGEAFIGRERLIDDELWLLKSQRVEIVPSRDAGNPISGYIYRGDNGGKQFLDADLVTHIKYPNPQAEDNYHGLSKLKELQQTLRLMWSSRETGVNFFKNGAKISGVFTVPHELTIPAYERMKEALKRRGDICGEQWRPLIAENGATWSPTGSTFSDAEMIPIWKLTREEVLACMGTPPVVVGLLEFANYANAREQRRVHYELTVIPLNLLITGALNVSPFVKRYGENVFLFHDYGGIEALQKDKKLQADVDAIHLDRGVITPNEIRLRDGLGKPLEGGDVPLPDRKPASPFGDLMGGGENGNGEEGAPPEESENEPEEVEADEEKFEHDGLVLAAARSAPHQSRSEFTEWLRARGMGWTKIEECDGVLYAHMAPLAAGAMLSGKGFEQDRLLFGYLRPGAGQKAGLLDAPMAVKANRRALQWRDIEKRRQPEERRWRRTLSRLFTQQEADVMEIIRRIRNAGSSLPASTKASDIPPDLAEILISDARLAEAWFEELLKESEKTFVKGAKGAAADASVSFSIDLDDPDLQRFLRERTATKITSIAANQRSVLRALVARHLTDGDDIEGLERTLRDTFKGMRRWKALQIARTETVGLINAGGLQQMKAAGAATKIWVTARDSEVRETHQDLDGIEIPIEQEFQVGDGSAMHPGETGLPEEDINCRCGTVLGRFVTEEVAT